MAPKSLRVNAFTYFYIKQVYNKKNFDYLQINYCRQKRKAVPTGATSLSMFYWFSNYSATHDVTAVFVTPKLLV